VKKGVFLVEAILPSFSAWRSKGGKGGGGKKGETGDVVRKTV